MTYTVVLEKKADKFYASADKSLARKLDKCFRVLEKTPQQHPNIKASQGNLQGRYRYRVGDYRVVYAINDRTIEVTILAISPRGNSYG